MRLHDFEDALFDQGWTFIRNLHAHKQIHCVMEGVTVRIRQFHSQWFLTLLVRAKDSVSESHTPLSDAQISLFLERCNQADLRSQFLIDG